MSSTTTISIEGPDAPSAEEFKAKLEREGIDTDSWGYEYMELGENDFQCTTKYELDGGLAAAEAISRKWKRSLVTYQAEWNDDGAGGERFIYKAGRPIESYEMGWVKTS